MVYPTVSILALVTAGWVSAHPHNEVPIDNVAGTHLFTARATAEDYLAPHNNERAEHAAKALVWDDGLASSAQAWANQCKFQHSQSGQNLYAGTGNPTAADAIGAWNSEARDYDPENPEASHWTQVVWKETTELGCALNQCEPGSIFDAKYGVTNYYVCHYNPAGNVDGRFPQSVQK